MRTIWHSLAWKEWHEHKWKLVSIATVLCSTTIAALLIGYDRFDLAITMQVACIVPLALFVGLATAAGERSRGTIRFLEALPTPMRRVATVKLLFGLVTLLVPCMLMVIPLYFAPRILDSLGFGLDKLPTKSITSTWYFDGALTAFLLASNLYFWSAAAGANRKDEVSAGATALAAMLGYWVLFMAATYLLTWWRSSNEAGATEANHWPELIGVAAGPGGIVTFIHVSRTPYFALAIAIALVVEAILAMVFIFRFGRVAPSNTRSPRTAVAEADASYWPLPPRRSTLTAIVWKQIRESGPLVLAGLAGAAGTVLLVVLPELRRHDVTSFSQVAGATMLYFYFIVSLVVGIGVFLQDLTPQLNTFWRTRPINPTSWFWTKFVSGWAVLFVSFWLPLLLIALYLMPQGRSPAHGNDWAFFAVVPLAIYATAVATTCLVRHAVYAAILSIPMIMSGVMLVAIAVATVRLTGAIQRPPDRPLWALSDVQVQLGLIITTMISVFAAWLAVRNDWGWKSRY
jgi:hypothetical protein